MNDFLILLQAKLDEEKSKGNINADIDKIQDQINKLKVQFEIDPKTISNLVKQLEGVLNQKINISNIGFDTNSAVKAAQQTGQQIGNAINQGISSASKSTDKILRDFSELNAAKRQFVEGHDLISKDDISDAERFYDTVRKAFSEFGQVTVSKGEITDGVLDSLRVKIEQVNNEAKITRDFMLYINNADNFGNTFKLADDDTIRSTEKMIQHLNEEKNIVNATNEEANAIKEKLAEQEKYYNKLEQASKEQLAIEKQRITAGEKQLEILDAQNKRRDSRISYNERQIDKKGLTDTTKQREINDLVYSGKERFDTSFAKEIDKSLSSLSKLKEKWQEQGIYVDEFRTKVENLEKSLNEISIGDVKGLNNLKQQLSSLSTEAQNLDKINKIQLSMDNGQGVSQYQNRIQGLINDFQKYGVAVESAKTQTSSLQQMLDNMKGLSGKELVAQADKFEQEFKAVKISIDEAKLSYDKLLQPVSSTKQVNLTNKIEKWLMNNTRATKSARQELKLYLKELSSGNINQKQYTEFSNRLTEIDTEMRGMGKLGKSLFQSLSEGAQKFTSWLSATAIVMRTITTIRKCITTVKELDTALVDLKKTAKMSAKELNNFYLSANDTAKQMGVTTQSIIEQAAAWSRLGFNTAEAATQMAKLSSQFQLISPGMSSDEAVSGLVSTMKAYNIEVNDVLDGIMSKINIIGNNFALSNADIVAMLQDSVSAMAEGNNTLEETIALETAAFEIAQDRSVGNGFKTVALRLRGINEETQELDDSLKTIKGDLYDLTGVSIMEDADTYKSTYQILKEMSEVWDSLTDKTQAKALELMFGKLRANIGASVLKNFSAAEKAMNDMANSAGNAEAEMSVAMDSIDYKLNKVKETGTGIAQNLFSREDMKSVLDVIGSLGNGLDKLTEKLGLFKTIGLGAGLFAGFKNVGRPKMFGLV